MAIAFPLIERWLASQDSTPDPFDAPDIFSVLNGVKAQLGVEPPVVVALFKRCLALVVFCAEVTLPKTAFNGRCPGRELMLAASKARVFEIPEEDDRHATSHF